MLRVTQLSGFGIGTAATSAKLVAADAGAYSLTGTAAQLQKAGNKTLTAAAGSYSLTGTAATVRAGWVTTFSQALNANSVGWSGYNMRQLLDSTLFSQSGSKVRLSLEGASAATASIDGMYIGHRAVSGDAYDFDGSQAQVTVGASASFTIGIGATVVTDPITFAFDKTKGFIIAVHFNATSSVRGIDIVAGGTNYFKSAANETATANVTGYTSSANAYRLVNKIEVM